MTGDDALKLATRASKNKARILLFDIETAPLLSWVWGLYEQNVVWTERNWYMLCFSYKWLGEKKTYVKSLPMYRTYKKDRFNDTELVKDLWDLFNEADMIIGHNASTFDIKKANTRFIENDLLPPSTYQVVDTLKVARRYFGFSSNKLNDLGTYLKLGNKVETGGYKLWRRCIENDSTAWRTMEKYNKQDVDLLEKVYLKLRPWVENHPNLNIINESFASCPSCNSPKIQKRGVRSTRTSIYQRFQCIDCGAWSTGTVRLNEVKPIIK